MQHQNLFNRMDEIKKELNRMLDEDPSCLEGKVDPVFLNLLEEAIANQKELDILMRGTFYDRPEELVKWGDKMQRFFETDAEDFLEALRSQEEDD
jgi:hypothetical protein